MDAPDLLGMTLGLDAPEVNSTRQTIALEVPMNNKL